MSVNSPYLNSIEHKAPALPHINPLSLQSGDLHLVSLPFSVGKIHQDGGHAITLIGFQKSSGYT